jgi:hypothetical protein
VQLEKDARRAILGMQNHDSFRRFIAPLCPPIHLKLSALTGMHSTSSGFRRVTSPTCRYPRHNQPRSRSFADAVSVELDQRCCAGNLSVTWSVVFAFFRDFRPRPAVVLKHPPSNVLIQRNIQGTQKLIVITPSSSCLCLTGDYGPGRTARGVCNR